MNVQPVGTNVRRLLHVKTSSVNISVIVLMDSTETEKHATVSYNTRISSSFSSSYNNNNKNN